MVGTKPKFPAPERTELPQYAHLEQDERVVACYLHLWRKEGWRPTSADVGKCAGVTAKVANPILKRAAVSLPRSQGCAPNSKG